MDDLKKNSNKMMKEYSTSKKIIILGLITLISVIFVSLLTVATFFFVDAIVENEISKFAEKEIPYSEKSFTKAAVASNGYLCAKIGKEVLESDGTAVDAAIATLFCEGVMCPQSMGLGGGFLMTIYDKKSGTVEVLNARETAPALSSENMFNGNATASEKGGLAVAVPSELKGYFEAYLKYGGGWPWKRLMMPSLPLCKEGFIVQKYLSDHIERMKDDILRNPSLRKLFTNPTTGQLLTEGDTFKNPKLCNFLETLSLRGVDPFYEGEIGKQIVAEVKAAGGILTEEDLKNYKVQWMKPVQVQVGPYTMYSSPVPGSGELLSFMLNVWNGFTPVADEGVTAQRIIETFKWAYGMRTHLADISSADFVDNITDVKEVIEKLKSLKFAEEIRAKIKDDKTSQDPNFYGVDVATSYDQGTCHISVLAPNGDAVSVTSTINYLFGALFVSESTGIIFNNEMADFSAPGTNNIFDFPPSPANFIRPNKRPFSSMCPTIFLNKDKDVELVLGASGGSRITSTVAYIALYNLMTNKTLKEAIDLPRLHHQLFPMEADYETNFSKNAVETLKKIGHKTKETSPFRTSTATAIRVKDGKIYASYDYRRGGSVDGF